MNSQVVVDLKSRKIAGYSSTFHSLNHSQPNWISPFEADLTNTGPASLITYLSPFSKQDFLPRPSPTDELRTQWTRETLPTWSLKVFTSSVHNELLSHTPSPQTSAQQQKRDARHFTHIYNDIGVQLSRPNWFFKTAYSPSTQQVNASFGIELWRNGVIANGVLRWRIPPDLYATTSSSMFWKELPELQYYVYGIRLTQPGVRYIDLMDHNGNIVRRIDVLQSTSSRFAYVENEKNKDESKMRNLYEYDETFKLPPQHNDITFHRIRDNDDESGCVDKHDDNSNTRPFLLENDPILLNTTNAKNNDIILHQPLTIKEKQHRMQYGAPQRIKSGFLPLINYLNDTIVSSISHQYHNIHEKFIENNDEIHQYLEYIHDLSNFLTDSTKLTKISHGYSSPEIESQSCYIDENDVDFEASAEKDQDNEGIINSPVPSQPTSKIIHSQLTNLLSLLPLPDFSPLPPTDNSFDSIPNNGDPFDMSNISDQQLLSLPRSDTPYTWHPDPYIIDGYQSLLNTARLLKMPLFMNYLNVYAKMHYYYIPPIVTKSISAVTSASGNTSTDDKTNLTKVQQGNGEHRVTLSAHLHSLNDKFHLVVAGSPSDHVYSARMAITFDQPSPNKKTPQHQTSQESCSQFPDNIDPDDLQRLTVPDVYYFDEYDPYERQHKLNNAKHIFGLQTLLYPSLIPVGYNVNQRAAQAIEKDPAKRPKFEYPATLSHLNTTYNSHISPSATTSSRLFSVFSPLNVIKAVNPNIYDWWVKHNMHCGLELQYAYVQPFTFNSQHYTDNIAENLDYVANYGHRAYKQHIHAKLNNFLPQQNNGDDVVVLNDKITIQSQDQSTNSTYFRDGFKSLRVVGKDITNLLYSYIPFLSSTTSQTHDILPTTQLTPSDPQFTPPHQQRHDNNNNPISSPLHQMFINKHLMEKEQQKYQTNMILGMNLNTNGVMQTYCNIDLSTNLTFSSMMSIDTTKTPSGAIRPVRAQSNVTIGFGINYQSRD